MPLVTQITLCCVSFLSFLLRVAAPDASTTGAVPHPHRGSRQTGAPIAPSPTGCPRRLRLLAPRAPSPLSSADRARRPRARTTGAPTVPHRSPNRQPCPRPHPPPAPHLGRGRAPSPHPVGAPSIRIAQFIAQLRRGHGVADLMSVRHGHARRGRPRPPTLRLPIVRCALLDRRIKKSLCVGPGW